MRQPDHRSAQGYQGKHTAPLPENAFVADEHVRERRGLFSSGVISHGEAFYRDSARI